MINAKCLQRYTVWYIVCIVLCTLMCKCPGKGGKGGKEWKNLRSEKKFESKGISYLVRSPLTLLDALLVARPLFCLVIWSFDGLLALDLCSCPLGSKCCLESEGNLHMGDCEHQARMATYYIWTFLAQMAAAQTEGRREQVGCNPESQSGLMHSTVVGLSRSLLDPDLSLNSVQWDRNFSIFPAGPHVPDFRRYCLSLNTWSSRRPRYLERELESIPWFYYFHL